MPSGCFRRVAHQLGCRAHAAGRACPTAEQLLPPFDHAERGRHIGLRSRNHAATEPGELFQSPERPTKIHGTGAALPGMRLSSLRKMKLPGNLTYN